MQAPVAPAELPRIQAVFRKIGENVNKIQVLLSQRDILQGIQYHNIQRQVIESLRNDCNSILRIVGASCSSPAAPPVAAAPSPLFLHPGSPPPRYVAGPVIENEAVESEEERIAKFLERYPTRESFNRDIHHPLMPMFTYDIWNKNERASYPRGNIRGYFGAAAAPVAYGSSTVTNGAAAVPSGISLNYEGGKQYRRNRKQRLTRRKRTHRNSR